MQAWRLRPEVQLRSVVWDDEAVVFNRGSRHTHVLNLPVLELLKHLEAGWLSASEIMTVYNAALPEDAGRVDQDTLSGLLFELDRLGVVESRPA